MPYFLQAWNLVACRGLSAAAGVCLPGAVGGVPAGAGRRRRIQRSVPEAAMTRELCPFVMILSRGRNGRPLFLRRRRSAVAGRRKADAGF